MLLFKVANIVFFSFTKGKVSEYLDFRGQKSCYRIDKMVYNYKKLFKFCSIIAETRKKYNNDLWRKTLPLA